jgi:hypothetical protein
MSVPRGAIPEESATDSAAMGLPVRLGLRYVRRLPIVERPSVDEVVHVLDSDERRALVRIESHAVLGGVLVGAMASALGLAATVGGEVLGATIAGGDRVAAWSITVGTLAAIGLATVLEIVLIYRICLRAVHRMAIVAGVAVSSDAAESEATLASLVAAAIQVPASRRPMFGVDPLKRCPRWQVWLAAILYKGKVFLSVLAAKLLLRRLLSRVAVRELVPFVGVPITAAWDGFVCRRSLRDARLRMFARSAAEEIIQRWDGLLRRDVAASEAALRAVACVAVEKRHLHDGLERLLSRLAREADAIEAIDDPDRLRQAIAGLGPECGESIRQVLLLASVCDGRTQGRVASLLGFVLAMPTADSRSMLREARRRFVRGDGVIDPIGRRAEAE